MYSSNSSDMVAAKAACGFFSRKWVLCVECVGNRCWLLIFNVIGVHQTYPLPRESSRCFKDLFWKDETEGGGRAEKHRPVLLTVRK
jgi:hypothetical protein